VGELILKKGGQLWKHSGGKRKNLTKSAIRHLFDICDLVPDIKLQDIFLLVKSSLGITLVLGNWCEEIVSEGLKPPKRTNDSDAQKVEYLELYKSIYVSKDHCYGVGRAEFHGIGHLLKKDERDKFGNVTGKKGNRIKYAIDLTPAYELARLPVLINKKMTIINDEPKSKNRRQTVAEYDGAEFTLGEILYGIFWEMSFHGPPKSRDATLEGLKQQIKDIDEGKVKMISHKKALRTLRKMQARYKKRIGRGKRIAK